MFWFMKFCLRVTPQTVYPVGHFEGFISSDVKLVITYNIKSRGIYEEFFDGIPSKDSSDLLSCRVVQEALPAE